MHQTQQTLELGFDVTNQLDAPVPGQIIIALNRLEYVSDTGRVHIDPDHGLVGTQGSQCDQRVANAESDVEYYIR